MIHEFSQGEFEVLIAAVDGLCLAPTGRFGVIFVDGRLKGKRKLDTIIHECIHAEFPDKGEREVADAATVIANLLWRLGYREKD